MTGVEQIFHKIREICEGCYQSSDQQIKIPRNYKTLSSLASDKQKQIPQAIIHEYLAALQYLDQFVHELKQCKIHYENLEEYLQKQETQIRKHIGIQQQLRLYSDSIKAQLEECEKEKLELLQNSKVIFKNLKLKNQLLFQELTVAKHKLQSKKQKTHQHSTLKSKAKQKSLSASGERKDSSLSKIIKTQYIERQKVPFLNANIRKQLKYKVDYQIPDKKHKHHQSTFLHEEPRTSESKKKHRLELLEKCKKEKVKPYNKQFNLASYLHRDEPKKSPFKNLDKSSTKQHSSKRTEKHHKSSFQQKNQRASKEERVKKSSQKQKSDRKQQNKQKSKSKQSKKKIKSKDQLKNKLKQPKKTCSHNRSLFSVSSVDYRTRNESQK